MPVSNSQHRASTGAYQNNLHDNFRVKSIRTNGISANHLASPEAINCFGSSISRAVNSHEVKDRASYQHTAPRQGLIVPLVMLLTQFRIPDSALSEKNGTPVLSPERGLSPSVPQNTAHTVGDNGFCPMLPYSTPSVTNDTPVSSPERGLSPSVPQNTAHTVDGDSGLYAMLHPVANALYEAGEFIARHDPLIFPAADASPMPLASTESTMSADIHRDLKSETRTITDEQEKKNLISSLVHYLVSDGQLTTDQGKDVELRLRSEAANMPMFAFRLGNNEADTSREKREAVADKDRRIAEHIEGHCAFEEEVLDPHGKNEGKVLIFQAQRAENPFRMIYDNDPNGRPSPETVGLAKGLNIVTDIITLGIKPLAAQLIASAKRQEYYHNQGDEICAERFKRWFVAELATSLDVSGLTFTPRGNAGRVKPSELLNVLPESERAVFYTRNPLNNIKKEILMELKQGKGAINDNGSTIYLKPTKKPNEYITYHPNAVKPEMLERRVIIDENALKWRYADSFDSSDLNLDIHGVNGKRQIKLDGDYYELQQNAVGKYEIVVNKNSGIKEFIPVYMEPLSKKWHLSTHNEHRVFDEDQIKFIEEIKVKKEDGYYYLPRGNNNQNYYGNGKIYVKEKMDDTGHFPLGEHIEINGELVPVKTITTPGHGVHYEVYKLNNPSGNSYPIEWDGARWVFERKTSAHVSKDLKKLISPKMFSEKVDSGKLSAPDHQGLRYDADGNKYIKIKNEYLKLEQTKDLPFIRMDNGDKIYVDYVKNHFKPAKVSRYNGLVSSSSNEMMKDFEINSLVGLDFSENRFLNEAWSLKGINIKNKNLSKTDAVGSSIDVTFTMQYKKLKNNKYIEMPALQWKEKIYFKEGDSKWHFQTDMYTHNPSSKTFLSWRKRYIDAYDFAKAKDKKLFNGNVRIYKNNMEPVGVNDIKSASTPVEKAKNTQEFLSKNGGVMEITITDVPQVIKRETEKNMERKLTFDIGFNDKVDAHFNQGVSLNINGETNVFVTTSDNIKLASGEANVQPPEIVTKPRDHLFFSGEIYP